MVHVVSMLRIAREERVTVAAVQTCWPLMPPTPLEVSLFRWHLADTLYAELQSGQRSWKTPLNYEVLSSNVILNCKLKNYRQPVSMLNLVLYFVLNSQVTLHANIKSTELSTESVTFNRSNLKY